MLQNSKISYEAQTLRGFPGALEMMSEKTERHL